MYRNLAILCVCFLLSSLAYAEEQVELRTSTPHATVPPEVAAPLPASPDPESAVTETKQTKKKLTSGEGVVTWQVDQLFAGERPCVPDTVPLNYQLMTTPVYLHSIAVEWLGNLGLPAQSAIFSERVSPKLIGDVLFRHPYEMYFLDTEQLHFYNTRVPYSNLGYYTGGYTHHGEDRLDALFYINANKRFDIGFQVNYLYGRGSYYNQSSNVLCGGLNGSYRGDRYKIYFAAGLNNFQNYENGGLKNDSSLYTMTDSYDLPVNLNTAGSQFKSYYIWVNQQVDVGYHEMDPDDSEKKRFVPVATIGYTAKFDAARKKYYEPSIDAGFYAHNYYSDTHTRDTTATNLFRNILSVTLNEGFKKGMVFGLRAFAEADVERNMLMKADSQFRYETHALVSVGGELFRRHGNTHYNVLAQVLLLGYDNRPAFEVTGNFSTCIPIKSEKLLIEAVGHVKSTNPSYFTEHYYSNHFIWENSFNNMWSARGYARVGVPNRYVHAFVGAGWQGLQDYIYFDKQAMPTQCPDFIQLVSGEVQLDWHVKWFHWENKAIVQYASKPEVLPLPLVSLYSNVYGLWKVRRNLLTIQFGVDCRYNTAYYASAYMPATGQFYLQDQTLYGNYPLMNVYLNMHLKQFRFFVMYYNLSQLFMPPKYFTVAHEPLNPAMVKIGLSWNFYN